ncbi:hypothetical protein [Sphingobium sp. sgz301304]|uniref:hypothetical protein n=1 Tax=Sphingobium sp. sgz301304 TaxID=3341828 RepID=UPI0035A6F544
MKRNAPARKGEGVECQPGSDIDAHSTIPLQVQYLAARLSLPANRAALIAPLAFGGGNA